MASAQFHLDTADLLKILKGAGIAAGGAALAYIAAHLSSINLGPDSYIIIPIASILINAGIKFFQGQQVT